MNITKVASLFITAAIAAGALAGCGGSTSTTETDTTATTGSDFDTSEVITVVSREDGSGTRGAFIELMGIEEKDADGNRVDNTTKEAVIANKTDVMLTNVSGNEYAIGYVSLGSLSDSVKAVNVDGVEATADNVKNGTYVVSRPFNIATTSEVSEAAQDFIDFILSAEGQAVTTDGYIPIDEDAPAYTGSSNGEKVVVGGSSSVSPIMEKLKEAYLELNPNAQIEVQMSDSTSGMLGTIEGRYDIGMASRELSDSEKADLTGTAIALDGIAVIVNPENPIENLTSDQIKDIFTGEIATWDEVQ